MYIFYHLNKNTWFLNKIIRKKNDEQNVEKEEEERKKRERETSRQRNNRNDNDTDKRTLLLCSHNQHYTDIFIYINHFDLLKILLWILLITTTSVKISFPSK